MSLTSKYKLEGNRLPVYSIYKLDIIYIVRIFKSSRRPFGGCRLFDYHSANPQRFVNG